jgi:hypothetical protein
MHCCQICLESLGFFFFDAFFLVLRSSSGPRNIASQQEAVLRRKLLQEEQQQQQQAADELQQQAIGLQSHRRFTGLQLLDLNSRAHRRLGSPVKLTSPISPPGQTDGGKGSADGDGSNAVRLEDVVTAGPIRFFALTTCLIPWISEVCLRF